MANDVATQKLDELLTDPALAQLFENFLHERFCAENLDFWRAAVAYKALPSVEARKAAAQELYERFISATASCEINIPASTREPLLQHMRVLSGAADVFDAAIVDVKRMLEWDSASSFVTSKTYLDFVAARADKDQKDVEKEARTSGYFDMIASPVRRLMRSGPVGAAPGSPRNFVKGIFSSPHKFKDAASPRSREGTPRKLGPKEKQQQLKDKPDNRFSPITKATQSPVQTLRASPARASPDKLALARTVSVRLNDAENRLNHGSPLKATHSPSRSMPMSRKALAVLGSTPPKYLPTLTASPKRAPVRATAEDEAAALLLTNPGGSTHVRFRAKNTI